MYRAAATGSTRHKGPVKYKSFEEEESAKLIDSGISF